MRSVKFLLAAAFAATASGVAFSASAQTVKIGFITSYSGLNGNLGP
jgi:ABC-type sugar transport system substrate-binding protein